MLPSQIFVLPIPPYICAIGLACPCISFWAGCLPHAAVPGNGHLTGQPQPLTVGTGMCKPRDPASSRAPRGQARATLCCPCWTPSPSRSCFPSTSPVSTESSSYCIPCSLIFEVGGGHRLSWVFGIWGAQVEATGREIWALARSQKPAEEVKSPKEK